MGERNNNHEYFKFIQCNKTLSHDESMLYVDTVFSFIRFMHVNVLFSNYLSLKNYSP